MWNLDFSWSRWRHRLTWLASLYNHSKHYKTNIIQNDQQIKLYESPKTKELK